VGADQQTVFIVLHTVFKESYYVLSPNMRLLVLTGKINGSSKWNFKASVVIRWSFYMGKVDPV